jgi:hypothetical protein
MPHPDVAYSQQTWRIWRHRAVLSGLRWAIGVLMISLAPAAESPSAPPAQLEQPLRVASYNVSLYRQQAGGLRESLITGSAQAETIAAVIQRVRPQLLLINEFDYDPEAAQIFKTRYLGTAQPAGGAPIHYPYHFIAPSNTGVPSGVDLDRDGRVEGGNDALGFGLFPGQYGMLVLSMWPIDERAMRSFRRFLWRDMPNNLIPPDWYSAEALAVLPLSSKSHWDVPVILPDGAHRLHLLASHPTPPGFDGPEDRNGRRNHDEIRLWADYVSRDHAAQYLIDDQGRRGGLAATASFVIAGDLNADPLDGGSWPGAIAQLLDHPRVHASAAQGAAAPRSHGGREAAQRQGGANLNQRGDPALDTADFSDGARSVGNLRVDYVLPSSDLSVCDSGIFWPTENEPEYQLVNDDARSSSDHRLVWVDIALTPQGCSAR